MGHFPIIWQPIIVGILGGLGLRKTFEKPFVEIIPA